MKKSAMVLLVTTILLLPLGLEACDCGCGGPGPAPIHFKDGLTPNGPVTSVAASGDPSYYASTFGFHDYGPAHVVVPPPAPDTKDMKRPSS